MSVEEKFVPWVPVSNLPNRLHCEAVHDDIEGLRVLLRGDAPSSLVLRIRFESAIGYRNVNESYRPRTWGELDMTNTPPLLTVENSSWIKWLQTEAGPLIDPARLTHYAVFTSEDCIDVASEFTPIVEWLNSPDE